MTGERWQAQWFGMAALTALSAGACATGCTLSSDDEDSGDVRVTLVGNLPGTNFANALAPHLSTMTVMEESARPQTAPVLINADAIDRLNGDERLAVRTNYRAGRSVVLLNAAQRHADALTELVGHPRSPQLFFYPENGRRRPAVALELEPDGQVQYVLRGDADAAFAEQEVRLFLAWLDEDGRRIGDRLYERILESEHSILTDISLVPDEAELKAHGEHEQTTHQFAGESGVLSVTTTSVTAYSCDEARYHSMVVAHVDGTWANDHRGGDELELIQLSRHIPGGELLTEPLVQSTEDVATRGFDVKLEAGAAFVLNDNRGTSVYAPIVTHVAQWPVQETDVPMGDGEAGSHLWTLSREQSDPHTFSYTTGWKWLFPVAASSPQQTITAPLGARIGDDVRDFTLTFKGPTTKLCR